MLRFSILALALLTTGCNADEPTAEDRLAGEVEEAVRDAGPFEVQADGVAISSTVDGGHVESILTRDGQMEMGLTDQVLYSRLSKQAQTDIQADLKESTQDQEGIGGRIARAVAQAAAENIGTAVQIPVADIRDLRVEGDRLTIEMADGRGSPFGSVETDGTPLLEAFAPADAQRLADAFQNLRP